MICIAWAVAHEVDCCFEGCKSDLYYIRIDGTKMLTTRKFIVLIAYTKK